MRQGRQEGINGPQTDPRLAPIEAWFSRQGSTPMPFQRDCWNSYLAGRSSLILVPTGSGKTYAAVLGPIAANSSGPRPRS